jgi:hypothetical protein
MKSKSTKKSSSKSVAQDYLTRLGPVREVVKMARDHSTKNAYVLTLRCGHKRVGTKRKTLRCRRCAK